MLTTWFDNILKIVLQKLFKVVWKQRDNTKVSANSNEPTENLMRESNLLVLS